MVVMKRSEEITRRSTKITERDHGYQISSIKRFDLRNYPNDRDRYREKRLDVMHSDQDCV